MRLHNLKVLLLVAVVHVSLSLTAPVAPHLDPATYLAIEKTLNAFSFAVDTRPVPRMDNIFTKNAYMALQPSKPPSIGIDAINEALIPTLPAFITQHSFGTKSIVLTSKHSATAVTDFIGTFWGTGEKAYDYLINFQQYHDTLARVDGEWRIENKTMVTMVRWLEYRVTFMLTYYFLPLRPRRWET